MEASSPLPLSGPFEVNGGRYPSTTFGDIAVCADVYFCTRVEGGGVSASSRLVRSELSPDSVLGLMKAVRRVGASLGLPFGCYVFYLCVVFVCTYVCVVDMDAISFLVGIPALWLICTFFFVYVYVKRVWDCSYTLYTTRWLD